MMIPQVSAHELKAMQDILLLDVRMPEEWEIARIAGAVLVPLPGLASQMERIKAMAGGRPVVVYCHTGRRSAIATSMLRQAGIDARNLHGGIEAWSAIDPRVPRY